MMTSDMGGKDLINVNTWRDKAIIKLTIIIKDINPRLLWHDIDSWSRDIAQVCKEMFVHLKTVITSDSKGSAHASWSASPKVKCPGIGIRVIVCVEMST